MDDRDATTTALDEDTSGQAEGDGDPDLSEQLADRPASLARRWWPAAASLAIYAFLATAIYGLSNPWASNTRIPLCACSDQAQEVWFLAWPAFAITHAHNLFYTWWMNSPDGVNLGTNTSMPLLGVVGAPITWLVGPVATYNVLLRLAFVLSSLSMCLVLRRWTTWWPAAFVGGLLYGFSTYMVAEGEGHLFLTMVPIPPLLFLMVDEILARRRMPARRAGILLGLLVVVQYLISQEVLVITLVSVLVVVAVVAVARHRRVRAVLRRAAVSVGWAVGVSAVLLGYPVWMELAGPQTFSGPPHQVSGLASFFGDLWSPITPTHTQWIAPAHLATVGTSFVGGSTAENGEYLGIPLVLAVVVFTIVFRTHRIVPLATLMIVVNLVLSLGTRLAIDNRITSIPLPYALLVRIPIAQAVLAVRFSFGMALFSAVVMAVGLDLSWAALTTRRSGAHSAGSIRSGAHPAGSTRSGPSLRRLLVTVALVVVAALAAVPLVPAFAYPSVPTRVPSLFTTAVVRRIPRDSVVLTYPYVNHPQLRAMLDQAVAGIRYKIVGSSAFIPGPDGKSFSGSHVLAPPQVQTLFYSAYYGTPLDLATVLPLATTVPEIRTYLRRYRVSTVIYSKVGVDPTAAYLYLTATLGTPTHVGGVTEWFDVQARLRHAQPVG